MSSVDAPVISAHDASYVYRDYRSFEFMTFSAEAGTVHALLCSEHVPARDALLAIAGIVQPTSGSLVVCDTELAFPAQPSRRRLGGHRPSRGRARLPHAAVGLGIFTGVAPVARHMTVEESVTHEAALRGSGGRDVLTYLAELNLATMAEQWIDDLDALGVARLSAALALAGEPKAAVIDLTDEALTALPAAAAAELVCDVGVCARRMGCAAVVATSEVSCARAADAVTPLDIASAEQLAASGNERTGAVTLLPHDQIEEVVA